MSLFCAGTEGGVGGGAGRRERGGEGKGVNGCET